MPPKPNRFMDDNLDFLTIEDSEPELEAETDEEAEEA